MRKIKAIEFIKMGRKILNLDLDVAVEVYYYAQYRKKQKQIKTKMLKESCEGITNA